MHETGAREEHLALASVRNRRNAKDNALAAFTTPITVDEVLASQAKMLTRRGEDSDSNDDQMKEIWENHLWKVKYQLTHQAHFDALELHYKEMIDNPREQTERIAEFLGGGLDADKMAGAVDEQLYRNRR